MMEISLIRHGKSQLVKKDKVTFREFKQWIEQYDRHGVIEEALYPSETVEKIAAAKLIITSDLKRAVESAKLLNPQVKIISDPLFRETELPAGSKELYNLKLSPGLWAVVLRVLWLSGYSSGCESLSQAKSRAKKAAQQLIGYAGEYQSVALMGHGFFNMLLARELQKKGWKGKRKKSAKHWTCTTYSYSNERK
jgi:broad specificity phosphatase PhoE